MSRTPSARLLLLGALLIGLAWSAGAQAAPTPRGTARASVSPEQRREAIRLTRRASALNNLGKYAQAIALFKKAVAILPKLAGAWRNMGLAHEGLKQYRQAITAYERYLAIAGTGGRYSLKVMERINECRKRIGLAPKVFSLLGAPGRIKLEINVSGAAIRLDGLLRGSSPVAALPVAAGLHVIEVTKEGYLTFNRSLGVKAGKTVVVRVALARDPSYRPPRRVVGIKHHKAPNEAYLRIDSRAEGVQVTVDGHPAQQNAHGAWVVPRPRAHVVEVRAPGRVTWRARVALLRGEKKTLRPILPLIKRKRAFRRWGWVSLGVAALLAGAGGVLGALENTTYEKVRRRDASDRAALEDLASTARRYRGASLGLYAAAGAALVSSIVLFVYERRGEHPKGRPLPLVIAPSHRGTGLAVSLRQEVDF